MQLATFFFDFDPFLCLAYSDEMHTELRKIRPHASFFAQLDAFVGQLPADEEVDEEVPEDEDEDEEQGEDEETYREAEEQVHYLFFFLLFLQHVLRSCCFCLLSFSCSI